MASSYQIQADPTKREVLEEMLKPVSDAFKRFPDFSNGVRGYVRAVMAPVKALKRRNYDRAVCNIVIGAAIPVMCAAIPFVLPSWSRVASDAVEGMPGTKRFYSNDRSEFVDVSDRTAVIVGASVIGTLFGACEYFAFRSGINSNPKYLAIPLATNALSGLYEIGRKAYRKAKERIVKRKDSAKKA